MTFNVSPSGEAEHDRPGVIRQADKARPRPRPTKALPTDRMKFDVQVAALRAIAMTSDFGKRGVGGDDIAPRLGVTASTAGLNNAFFAESGLVARETKGKYKPTPATVKFAQKASFDTKAAGIELAPALRGTWFFREVAREAAPRAKLIEVLAYAAGTDKARQVQVNSLLTWLEYAGLIVDDNGTVRVTSAAAPEAGHDDGADPEPDPSDPPESERATKDLNTGKSVDSKLAPRGEALLGFAFDFSLTADELAKLSPDQIKALFEAVGNVAAIKGAINAQND